MYAHLREFLCIIRYYISQDIVRSIFDFSGMKQDEKIIEACVGDVRRSLDRNRDGLISKEEFINNARFVLSLNYIIFHLDILLSWYSLYSPHPGKIVNHRSEITEYLIMLLFINNFFQEEQIYPEYV